ncbi:aminoglycoside phosphotransferase family protein [Phytohabitans sp. ZYX-F-186]|uniref:Aminoglycoside phosphotransferase family protein n=1 Tax=Phytohabitans maris TaxID=3071409 RepID=A0ABU0ZEC1_9ACTN|nr:aminoglycoside phosphotransferase family protein [Phytohabitans sp. ZYX-F-186]MDQ7905303.1 aminoglycoside phosphotransferase family protein [Phytohabitans sp. ZYX-F-186]
MRDSVTKRRVSEAELARLVSSAFGPSASVAGWRELAGGTYNAAYAVTLDDGRELVLKVAPPPHLELLTHEVDLMRTEVDFYRRAAAVGVPVPEVVYAGFERDLLGTDFAFFSLVPGTDLRSLVDSLPPAEIAALRGQVAGLTARLHTITGSGYGYPLRGSRSWQSSWRGAFGAMVDDLMADAERLSAAKPLPAPPERIAALMRRHASCLDEVTRPALVHFDLWDGNVFVERGPQSPDGWRITGFIDGERAFYGDPIAELVSLTLFREPEPELLAGIELTESVSRRLNLYTTYLYVIMAIEGATRGWYDEDRVKFESWLAERIDAQLALL